MIFTYIWLELIHYVIPIIPMVKKYSLIIIAFLCFSLSGYGQTTVFDAAGGGAYPSGAWSDVNNITAQEIDRGSYYLVDAGNPSDIITTAVYDLSAYASAEFSLDVASFGGGSYNPAKIEISFNGGTTFTQTEVSTTTTGSSYIDGGTFTLNSVTNQVQIRISNNGTSGRGVRLKNLVLTGYGSGSTDTELNFASTTYSVNEDDGTASICVDITNESATATTADIVLTSASTPHVTYSTTGITFPANSSTSQCVTVNIADNTNCSDSTDYTFEIQNVAGGDSATAGSDDETTLSVNDDDTANTAIIDENFSTLGTFNQVSETGSGISWISYDDYAVINGYDSGATNQRDWLIFNDAINFDTLDNESLVIDYEERYSGNNVEVFYSNNFNGTFTSANTSSATWTSLGTLNELSSSGSWGSDTKTFDLTGLSGSAVYIGLLYTSTISDAENWRIDSIELTADACLCAPPAAPIGSISGTTPACASTTLSYSGTAAAGTINYWQTNPTGTDEIYNATATYTATTSGTYYVRAYDTAGTCWSDNALSYAVVIEDGVPTLTQPTNQTEVIPDTATFSVSSSDTDSYQWQVNTGSGWNNVTGGSGATTDTYTTAATSAPMDGSQYRCILTNICGNTTSNAVTLNLSNEAPNNARNIEGCFEDTTVTLNWDAPASGVTPTGYMVFARDGGTDPTGTKDDANTYTPNTDFSAATTVTPVSLGRVVYKGTATTATITGLTEDNNYSFTVYAYFSETLTGWANGGTAGSTVTNGLAQGDITNLTATPLTNKVTLNWNNPLPTACYDQLIIIANQGGVTFTPTGDGSAYSGNDNDVYASSNQLVYETTSSASTKSITGLTNGTNYCFKIFIRRGTTWTEGVEVCTTPSLTYCDSYGDGGDGYLTLTNNVQFNTINNASDNTDNAYSDYTAISTTVTIGQTYNLEVRVNTDGEYFTTTMVWFDWNNDGDFSDANEDYDLGVAYNAVDGSTDESPLSIEIPSNAVIAATRMRVSTKYYDTDYPIDPPTPCETSFDGEVEDYTINIVQPVDAEINVKGNNISIDNGFNAPYGLNNTLFASTNVGDTGPEKAFFIENIGATTLNLTGTPKVEIIGAHASDFSVTLQPSATVGSGSSSEFRVEFNPTSDGVRTAQVSIENSDSDEDPYIFDIEGSAVCSTVLTSSVWPTEGPENTEITITSANDLTGATATINGLAMTTISTSASELVVLLPEGATDGDITVLFSTGCSSENAFTVISDDISTCETTAVSTPPTDLFMSQISDATTGSSSLVEIFNGTASAINLNNYSIRVFNNGNASASSTLNLTGTIASGGIHVISIGTSSCDFTAASLDGSLPHQSFNSANGINFKYDSSDLIELYNSSTATSIDVFGVFGSDNWSNGLVTGENGINFSRINTASALPSTTFNLADWDITDWTDCSDSDYSNFGVYDFALATPPSVSVLTPPVFNCLNTIQIGVTGTEGVPSGSGLTYQWFYLEPSSATFVAVPNNADFDNVATATLDILNPISYLEYQFYCQVREDDVTCYKASNAVKLDAVTASWDGTTWSTAPASDKFVVINGAYDTSVTTNGETSFEACSCEITTGNELIIADNTYVKVENNLVVDGSLVVQPYGAFVQVNDAGTVTGNILSDKTKIQVYKKTPWLESRHEYVYWSAPVFGETIGDGLAEANTGRRYTYLGQNFLDATAETNNNGATVAGQDDVDDNGDDWLFVNGATIMQPGVGYAATQNNFAPFPTQIDYIFEGPFNNGIYNIPIYRNDSELNDNNWNLIGNPYPSAIDADLFLAANASIGESVGSMTGAIFFWSHATAADANANGNENLNYAQSDYAIINGSGQTKGGDNVTPTRFIPSGQAFFVSMDDDVTPTTASGDIKSIDVEFNNSMRVTGNNDQFFRSSTTTGSNRLWLNLTTDNGASNQILIAYVNGATDADDGMYYDAPRNLSTDVNAVIYSLLENSTDKKQFVIQGKDPNNLTLGEVIPLSLITTISEPTIYTISIDQFEGDFMTENAIYIKDNLLNTTHNLKNSDYTFTSETGEFNNRFEIVFTPTTLSIDDNILDANTVTITELQHGDVQIKVGNAHTIKHVDIIDVTGRIVYSLTGDASTEIYNLSKLSEAAYIAKITLSNGQIISKKAIKQR
ncbi:choice-of-anchor D domain-containing protein [Winogradskyella sp. F6397]|uniref:Choice-of-anchor D domain-containing protein n=1 Tax=Winogradskyella marina TaxID=2785530 RepID=A0ABS0EH17_9FLAO|nr:GEVED domain-containing protein [Winogradskyella marina]MBF8149740.1 choice-of-anchor D domain-containing protein [Winogradskyella marina]